MDDEPQARPLSGEILTADAQPLRSAFAGEIVDAEYVTLDPQTRPSAPPRVTPAAPRAGMEMLRKDEAAMGPIGPLRGGAGFWLLGFSLAAGAFWISGGYALVGRLPSPFTADAANPLRIEGLTSRVERQGDGAMLMVDGAVANSGPDQLTVPPLVIAVTAGDGRVTRYNLGTNGAPIAPGERFAFSSRLAAPMDGGTSVSVTFQDDID